MSKFDINGAIIEFDEKMDNYNAIRKLFKEQAISLSNEFEDHSLKNHKSLKRISENCLNLGLDFIEKSLKSGVETLISYNVITVDLKTFKEVYCKKYLNYERLFNNLNKEISSSSKNKRQSNLVLRVKSHNKNFKR